MQVFRSLPPRDQRRPCALTIGNFDGVHRGHRALLAALREHARQRGLATCVLTFEPHPREFFARVLPLNQAPTRVAALRDKLDALCLAGIDRVCITHFSARFAAISAEQFVADILVSGLQTRFLLIGDDFRFGSRRSGDFAFLEQASIKHGFEVAQIATVAADGLRISSSAVRDALADGDMARAASLLGRPYAISGHVIHGKKLGRALGFPTLNIRIPHGRPALGGIFIVQVHGLGNSPKAGVASLGTRPAVETHGKPLLEVHLLDWEGDAYGQRISVEILHKLRDEAHYEGLSALTEQIQRDVEEARCYLQAPDHATAVHAVEQHRRRHSAKPLSPLIPPALSQP